MTFEDHSIAQLRARLIAALLSTTRWAHTPLARMRAALLTTAVHELDSRDRAARSRAMKLAYLALAGSATVSA